MALAGAGCSSPSSSPPRPPAAQAVIDAPDRWRSIPVAEFSKRQPAFVKAIAAGELKVPDSGILLVTDEHLKSYKVRVADGAIQEVWRERQAD